MKRTFQQVKNRNAWVKEMTRKGHSMRKYSLRSQVLSPDYVWDYSGTGSPNGYGGREPEYFSVIFCAETV